MNPIGYTMIAIKNVKTAVGKDGAVLYIAELDKTDLSSLVSGYLAVEVTFAVKDGRLSYIIYALNPESYYYGYNRPTVHVKITVTFNEY